MPPIAQIKLDHCNCGRRPFASLQTDVWKLFGKVWDEPIRKCWEGQILSPTNKQRGHAVAPTASRGLSSSAGFNPADCSDSADLFFPPAPAAAPRYSPSRFGCPHTPTNTTRFRHLAAMFLMDCIRRGKVTQRFTGQSVASLPRWFGPRTLKFRIEPP